MAVSRLWPRPHTNETDGMSSSNRRPRNRPIYGALTAALAFLTCRSFGLASGLQPL